MMIRIRSEGITVDSTNSRVRLADVAKHSGVSTATVSRVLNGKREVAGGTRNAVLAALDMLGYERPETLRPRATGLVGVIVPELANPVFPVFAQSIESRISSAGYTPVICTQSPGGTMEDQFVEMLLAQEANGMIFVSGLHADSLAPIDRYQRLINLGMPFVLVNGSDGRIDAPALATDAAGSMDLAVRHLRAQGHARIGLAIGPERFIPSQYKRDGFKAAMAQHCHEDDPPIVTTLYTVEGGQGAAGALIDNGCTAVVCGSDLMALGAVRAARSRGLEVPTDVSVIGFDDSTLMAFTDPPLTTLRQPIEALSAAAVDSLVAAMTDAPVPHTELKFPAELIVRSSTGAAPASR